MNPTTRILLVPVFAIGLSLAGCGGGSGDSGDAGGTGGSGTGGSTTGTDTGGHDHAHDEVSLGTATIGDMKVECWQGHGVLQAGVESHLVAKLPYSDKGSTIVRAWLGTEDRTKSMVGKADYAPSHDDYDIHAEAPNPLTDDTMWWIEVTKPDGTKAVGSIAPRR